MVYGRAKSNQNYFHRVISTGKIQPPTLSHVLKYEKGSNGLGGITETRFNLILVCASKVMVGVL